MSYLERYSDFISSIVVKNITYRKLLMPFVWTQAHLGKLHLDLAKTSPHILHPERFALHLGTYMVSKYSHIHKAFVTVEQLRWKHIDVNGQEHNHAFWRDGDEKRLANVEVRFIHMRLRQK